MTTDLPNVLLVILDSVRAKNTSLCRDDRETTPNLRALASQATVHEKAIAPGLASTPSHASLFTGYDVVQHRVTSGAYELSAETIWDELSERGYETGLFSHNAYLTRVSTGLGRPFDYVSESSPRKLPFSSGVDTHEIKESGRDVYLTFLKRAFRRGTTMKSLANGVAIQADNVPWIPYSLGRRSGSDVTEEFARWHDDRTESWAACINYMDAHVPYRPRPEFNEWATSSQRRLSSELNDYKWNYVSGRRPREELQSLEDVYDECILQADAEVDRLVRLLERRDALSNTLLVITSDHGEGFGEVGSVLGVPSIGHGGTGGPEEQILHVPLVAKFPKQTRGACVNQPVSLTRFPDVVRAVVTGSWTSDAFVSDKCVTASSFGLSEGEYHSKPSDVTAVSEYNREARVVYEYTSDGEILKYVVYGEEGFAFDVTNPREAEPIPDSDDDPVAVVGDVFDDLRPIKNVRNARSERISKATREHLEDLGYR